VTPLGRSENSGFIIQSIVALGRALNLSVLVEGVETEEQRMLLRLAGCDEMQGFLFGSRAQSKGAGAGLLIRSRQRQRGIQAGASRQTVQLGLWPTRPMTEQYS
jgi:EAL domain-containing protein (putative c-di-GMP-specific phosphodiesterase class I)